MSAEDMAKIGLLCLNKGSYDNKQIISSGWIEEIIFDRVDFIQEYMEPFISEM